MSFLHTLSSTLLLLFLLHLLRLTSAQPPQPPPEPPCSGELEAFSVCLPFLSSSSSNNTPPVECCDGYSSAFSSNRTTSNRPSSSCLCSLLRQPLLLGFPINSSRLFSLASSCIRLDSRFRLDSSRASLCPGSPALPPLRSITGPRHEPPNAHPEQQSHAHMTDSSSEPNSEMPTSTESSTTKLMTNECRWIPLFVIFFFTYTVKL